MSFDVFQSTAVLTLSRDFQQGKEYVIVSTLLFNLHAEYIIWNDRLDKAQAEIKIARRNINNLRYADDTTLLAESEEN